MPGVWSGEGFRLGCVRWLRAVGLTLGGILLVAAAGHAGVLDASWIEPTTNTDGSPLTDLVRYRIYYSTSASPCPGSTFFQVAASTSAPPPNHQVSFRLTGLQTGSTYSISVTAVDSEENESACSAVASAVAHVDFAVTPTGTVSFGNVTIGSSATKTFTVQSTRSGTITGTASVPAPFSIVSGSPFTLIGTGATATVTVRFTPTSTALASTNVNFIADGDTLSRLVTGTGTTGLDTPQVTITSPQGPTYSTSNSPITLVGTASDNVGVTQVTWSNSAGGSGTATGTTNWTASVALQLGTNVLTVTARDAAGNIGTATLTVTLTIAFTFTDNPLVPRGTVVRAVHFVELRAAIDAVRGAFGLMPFAWADAALTPGSTSVRVVHLTELRRALNEAYQAVGRTPPIYTDSNVTGGVTVIQASHLTELRAAVLALLDEL